MNYDLRFDHIIILYYSIKLDKVRYPKLIGLPHVSTSISLHMTPNWELLCSNSCWAFSTFQVANQVLTWGLFKRTHDPKHWSLSCLNSRWVLLISRIIFQLCLQIHVSNSFLICPWICYENVPLISRLRVPLTPCLILRDAALFGGWQTILQVIISILTPDILEFLSMTNYHYPNRVINK